MDPRIKQLYQVIQRLIGSHRQLMDGVRAEKDALLSADLKAIQEATYHKEAAIADISSLERERKSLVYSLAVTWKRKPEELTFTQIVIQLQGMDLQMAEQFRSAFNTLTVMVQRISEQNQENGGIIERSLHHILEMKKNILGEARGPSDVYTQRGQKTNPTGGARLIAKEA